jgi:hypothetical protein
MQVWGRILEKLHYNAVFGVEVLVGKMERDWGFGGGSGRRKDKRCERRDAENAENGREIERWVPGSILANRESLILERFR